MKPSFQRRAFWSFAGLFLLGLAGWEAVQVTRGGRTAFSKALLPPPSRSHSGERTQVVRETQTGDPIANYLARAKRGMTESEVRWVLEDFEAAGLEGDLRFVPVSGYRALREKQQRWYLAAISEALGFSDVQKNQAAQKLSALLDRDENQFRLHTNEPDVINEETGVGCRILEYIFAESWLQDVAFAPWNLCELNEAQLALTWKAGADHVNRSRDVAIWMREPQLIPVIQDPISGNEIEFRTSERRSQGGQIPYYLRGSTILPLTPDQRRMSSFTRDLDLIAKGKVCQPAQLRMALLIDPTLAFLLNYEFSGNAVHAPSSGTLPAE